MPHKGSGTGALEGFQPHLTPFLDLSGSLSSSVNIGDDSGVPAWLKGARARVKNLGQAADHNRQIMDSAFRKRWCVKPQAFMGNYS